MPGAISLSSDDPHVFRLDGTSESIRTALRDIELLELLALVVTELGEDPAMILVLAVVYWLYDRESTAALASYVTIGIALVLIVKTLLAMPRPPEEVWHVARDYDPYGFPSGHAFNAVVVYGGLLYVFRQARNPTFLTSVVAIIVGVSLSRVVLGVHYLGDIVVGALFGLVFLVSVDALVDRNPVRGFALGVVVAVLAIIVSHGETYALISLGAALGGLLGSLKLDAIPDRRSSVEGVLLMVFGVALLVVVVTIQEQFVPESAVATVIAYTVVIGGILLVPIPVNRLYSQTGLR